jgi:ABC-type transport system involved in multi-copper enzyme maturation permease subunit
MSLAYDMAKAAIQWIGGALSLPWLTGPILEKELRVSSRRRRNYALRFGYVAAMTLFVVLLWLSTVGQYDSPGRRGASAYQLQRMAETGKEIIGSVCLFQFCLLQLLAVVLCSTAVNEEILRRTLGTLMTTPVTSFQIVVGKMLSKLLQLLLLLAISLPILAVVRVFGGVPWDYVVSSLCLTVTASLFLGSISLHLSIRYRRAYVVILLTLLVTAFLYLMAPWLLYECRRSMGLDDQWFEDFLLYTNPFFNMVVSLEEMTSLGRSYSQCAQAWPVLCGILLGASLLILAASTAVVRKAALRQGAGQDGFLRKRPAAALPAGGAARAGAETAAAEAAIRRVRGGPVAWKELRVPWFRNRMRGMLAVGGALLLLVISYAICANRELERGETHSVYGIVFVLLGILVTTMLSAAAISSEKEARSLPLLLATTLSNGAILWGKAVGVLWRCAPVWALLVGHVLLFSAAGLIDISALPMLTVMAAGVVVLLIGSGLFFSACFRHTTTAVIMNLGFAVLVWAVVPLVFAAAAEIDRPRGSALKKWYATENPVVQTAVVLEATSGSNRYYYPHDHRVYHWPASDISSPEDTWAAILLCADLHFACGVGLAVAAARRLRRGVF